MIADDATVAKAGGLMYKMICHIRKSNCWPTFQIVRTAEFTKWERKNKLGTKAKSDLQFKTWIFNELLNVFPMLTTYMHAWKGSQQRWTM